MASVLPPTSDLPQFPASSSSVNVDKVVQSVTNATKRLSQISTSTNNSNKKRKSQNRIGPWKLGRTLGRGSTGRVRLAKNINTGKLAAIKIVPKSNFKKLENPKYKHMSKDRLPYGIEREIIIMKLITHPNIMGLYDVWENKNDLYLILEYVEGGELFDYLIKRGKLQEFEAINYFKQIINGIGYLHQFNICHRDLKPENLLLDFNKKIKIADFGMAALEVKEKLLETSCGSPHYASPEIVAGKNYHGAPSDIWSCGVILFALLTGHLPFDDENIRKLLLKVQNGKFVMPPNLSPEAKDLISRMLKIKPEDRITIEQILTHPLLTKYPDSKNPGDPNILDFKNLNIKPIESFDKIDKEILKNLSILFHNCPEKMIISKLLSQKNYPEKMFYYLLMKYRNEHIENNLDYTDDDVDLSASLHTNGMSKSSSSVLNKTALKKTVSKKVLTNITNTSNSSFSASTSFNKKKNMVINNQVVSRASSSKSIKISKSPKRNGSKIKRKLTGMELNYLAQEEEPLNEPRPESRASSSNGHKLSKMEQYERDLANRVHKMNDAMATKIQQEEEEASRKREAKLREEQEKQRLERERAEKERQRHLTEKTLQQKDQDDLEPPRRSSKRFVTDPVKTKSSLDPRIAGINSLLRAKSFTSPSSYASLRRSGMNENTTKVLQKLGIELSSTGLQYPSNQRFSGSVKTSSSKRLSDYIQTNANDEDKENIVTVSDFNKKEKINSSVITPTISNKSLNGNNMAFRSLLSDIKEDKSSFNTKASLSKFQFKNSESRRSGLIPNPRFSRFSFNGLLTQFDEAGDISIYNSTLQSSGTVIQREISKKPSTRIKEYEVDSQLSTSEQANNFVSVELSEPENDDTNENNASLIANAITDPMTLDVSQQTFYPGDLSRNDFDTDISQMDIISSRVADIGKLNQTRPSLIQEVPNSSEERLSHQGFYQAKTAEKPHYSYNGSDSNYDMLDSSTLSASLEAQSEQNLHDDEADDQTHGGDYSHQISGAEEHEKTLNTHSNTSTQIFSTLAFPRATRETEDEEEEIKNQSSGQGVYQPSQQVAPRSPIPQIKVESAESPAKPKSSVQSPKIGQSVFKRLSLKPKREAPKAPQTFNQETDDEPKANWFMKFIHSLSSSSSQNKQNRKNLHSINSNLMSSDLMRIVKNTLQLKKIEGTLSQVNIDEEFGLIDGTIPSKFAYGRKLKFRIEVIDLVNASSLHILKLKGSEKGFKNLIEIVDFIVKSEEDANNNRKSALSFSGYQQ